ncbi:DUF4129 domain-containing protein [Cnuibacter sp. UC19_7]|uniref:DUF4129 domain-containing protein n=1 Tax=Cnuibacter sp. UC19_7 TaxID=3350166 RepID=UPI0036713770
MTPSALLDPPVQPDADQGRQWLLDELSKPEYQAARPTWFDQASKAFGDWLDSLQVPGGPGFGPLIPLVIVLIVAALIVVAFLVFGRPRLNRKSSLKTTELFGADDTRSAAEIRAAARRAASAGDWPTAIEEQYRAIARALAERTVVLSAPGTTAQDFAGRAGRSFPASADVLRLGARAFDEVRYLDQPGSREGYERLVALDGALERARPARLEAIPAAVAR